ncbi:CTD nuclear envelope phosphatase 1A [Hymenolepis weldensis]
MQYQSVRYHIIPLSPLSKLQLCLQRRKVMVIDLDETLIHSVLDGVSRPSQRGGPPPDFVLKVDIEHHPVRFSVHKRPHVDYFLSIVSQWYELVIFTASLEIYGAGVADHLDNGRHIFQRRYFRQHCLYDSGSYSKDLSRVSTDLSSIFILDNSPGAYRSFPGELRFRDMIYIMQQHRSQFKQKVVSKATYMARATDNAIPIQSWFSDPQDTALLCLLPVLDALRFVSDVRSILSRNLHREVQLPSLMAPRGSVGLTSSASSVNPVAAANSTTRQSHFMM